MIYMVQERGRSERKNMAAVLRAAGAATRTRSFRQGLSTFSAFSPAPPATPPPKADPSTNLFVSGKRNPVSIPFIGRLSP